MAVKAVRSSRPHSVCNRWNLVFYKPNDRFGGRDTPVNRVDSDEYGVPHPHGNSTDNRGTFLDFFQFNGKN